MEFVSLPQRIAAMLFEKKPTHDSSAVTPASETAGGTPRLRVPQRDQVEMHCFALDQLLPFDHAARVVWQAVKGWDLSRWLGKIKAVQGSTGRASTDPRLLVALWVYATIDGIGSAREIERRCETDVVYQWLCGGVSVNHHLLSDFRSKNEKAWDDLMTQIVASLLKARLVTMKRIAQDGMRVRASAGSSSFRRKGRLDLHLAQAREQVETLKRLAEENPDELNKRQRAAQERAVRVREELLEQARRECDELQEKREKQAKISGQPAKEAKASSTDPEARIMKFADGGYRPGYNVQFATDVESGVIVGVDTVNAGADSRELPPMLEQLEQRYQRRPAEALVDGGFSTRETIEKAAARNCLVFGPIKDEKKLLEQGEDPYARKRRDSDAVAEWRTRMGTLAGKAISKLRGRTAEWVNAQARNRGFWQMPVRGLIKCRTVATLYAITHNLLQGVKLRAEASAGLGG